MRVLVLVPVVSGLIDSGRGFITSEKGILGSVVVPAPRPFTVLLLDPVRTACGTMNGDWLVGRSGILAFVVSLTLATLFAS